MIQFENCVQYFGRIILNEIYDNGAKAWVAGGAVRDYFMGVRMKTDYDLFFPDRENYDKVEKYLIDNGAEVIWTSDNGTKVKYNGRKFDLVKHHFKSPVDTINQFDFTVSMFAVDNQSVYHGNSSFIDLSKRQLMFNAIPFPESSMSRAFRYYQKGFKMCHGEMAKLIRAIKSQNIQEEISNDDGSEKSSLDHAAMFVGLD